MKNKNKLIRFLLTPILLIAISCSSKKHPDNELSNSQITSMNAVLKELDIDTKQFESILFLILRDCDCVEENIKWVEQNIGSVKDITFFYIKGPEEDLRWLQMRTMLEKENASYFADTFSLSEAKGFVSSTDKILYTKNGKIISGVDFNIIERDKVISPQ